MLRQKGNGIMTVPVVSSSTLAVDDSAGVADVLARLSVPSAPTGSVACHTLAGNDAADDKCIRSDTPETSASASGETTLPVPIRLSDPLTVARNGSLHPQLTHPIIAPLVAVFATATINVAREQPASTQLVFAQGSL